MSDTPLCLDDEEPESFATTKRVEVRKAEPAPVHRGEGHRNGTTPSRSLPASEEAEQHVIACCLLDEGVTLDRAAVLTADHFYSPQNQVIFSALQQMRLDRKAITLEVLAEELMEKRTLPHVGGMPYLMQVVGKAPTTSHAQYFIEKVREKALLRQAIRAATQTVEEAYSFSGGLEEFLATAESRMTALGGGSARISFPQKQPSAFTIPAPKDRSVLLGNRYLNRGDGIILSGPSGMGKSSMELQMAFCWALGKPFHGIGSNGPLKSLIVQSEDSDGDIAEVWASLMHVIQPTLEERTMLDQNVRIVTDRVNRGTRFIGALKTHLRSFSPDLVWLNPLQAFIDGDVTESRDLGAFLREGLNQANSESNFGYIIVHHTTKPSTGKDRHERLWHEVMYDMAGGAELINWARAIMSLRPGDVEGEFKLILAKRGRRAGVVKMVEQGIGTRPEPVTTIGLKHAQGKLSSGVPIIYWEACEAKPEEAKAPMGRPSKYKIEEFYQWIPHGEANAKPASQIHRDTGEATGISGNGLKFLLHRAKAEGKVQMCSPPNKGPCYYQ